MEMPSTAALADADGGPRPCRACQATDGAASEQAAKLGAQMIAENGEAKRKAPRKKRTRYSFMALAVAAVGCA